MALRYVARFATSAARLEAYLARKLKERGWAGEPEEEGENRGTEKAAEIVARFVAAGYVDDEAYARARSGSLARRGYGQRRIDMALDAAGIAGDLREAVRGGEGEQRRSALSLARRRRFGPFGREPADRATREKQLAAMARAGHRLDMARELVDAPSVEAAELWAADDDGSGFADTGQGE
jgi:regulatory protein